MAISLVGSIYSHNNNSELHNVSTVPSVAAVAGDKLIFISHWRSKVATMTLPTWNGQTFTQIGSLIDTGEASIGLYELIVSSSATTSIDAAYSEYVWYNNMCAVVRDSAASNINVVLSAPQIYNSGAYTSPSIAVTAPTGALVLDFLAATGWDIDYSNLSTTTWTPNTTSRGDIKNTGSLGVNVLNASSTTGVGSSLTSSWTASAGQPMYAHLVMYVSSTPAIRIDTITDPVSLGSTGNAITTTGLGTLTSLVIGGKAVSSLSAASGDGTFAIPTWVHDVQGFLIGSGQTVVAGDGTNTASSTVAISPPAGYSVVTLTSVNTSEGYLGNESSLDLTIGDQIIFPTATSLGVEINYIDVDGGIYTDFSGSQILFKRNVTTGIVTQITLTNGVIAATKHAMLWFFGM